MRHKISGNKLGRNQTLRKATVRDLAKATLIQERVRTTKAKAKEARKLVDKLITLGKSGTLADKRRAFAILCDHKIVSNLFKETAPRFKDRTGGYTRILLLGNRRGDNAQLAFLELTEKTEVVISKPKTGADTKKGDATDIPAKEEDKAETKEATKKPSKKEPTAKKSDVKSQAPAKKADPKGKGGKLGGLGKIFKRKTSTGQ